MDVIWIILAVGGAALAWRWANKETKCPRCGGELEDSGYEGIRKWCPNKSCNWRNYHE